MELRRGDALSLIDDFDQDIDLIATDPPYSFGGNGSEHELSATVAIVLREAAKKLKRGCWMVSMCASSWRSTVYIIESVRNILNPVRFATWAKPSPKTKVRTPGWEWTSVNVVAFRKGDKNNPDLGLCNELDYIVEAPLKKGRRAQLPGKVAEWMVKPFVIKEGIMLDPFAGSGTLPKAAEKLGMKAYGFERSPK